MDARLETLKVKEEIRALTKKQLRRKKREAIKTQAFLDELQQTVGQTKTRVSKVHVNGLNITRDDLVKRVVSKVLKAETINDVLTLTETAHSELKDLGCFQVVNAEIDENNGNFEVSFDVEELPLSYVHGTTETGDNEAILVLRGGVPNMSGRGERLESKIKMGSGGTQQFSIDYNLPLQCKLLWNLTNCHNRFRVLASLYRRCQPLPWTSFQHTSHGLSIGVKLSPKPWLTQLVQWDCAWRHLHPQSSIGFTARSISGHTLKSSLNNVITVNTLDNEAVPSNGMKVSISQELAGIALGNVAFFKTVADGCYFKDIGNDLIIGATCSAGSLSHMIGPSSSNTIPGGLPCDKFTLGGPVRMRGFRNHCLGPKEDGDYTGCNAYWNLSFYARTKKLPFLRGDSWIVNNVSAHVFAEFCRAGNPSTSSYFKWLFDSSQFLPRISVGLGLVAKLGSFGRAELNYCIPLRANSSDLTYPGLQLGIGVQFA